MQAPEHEPDRLHETVRRAVRQRRRPRIDGGADQRTFWSNVRVRGGSAPRVGRHHGIAQRRMAERFTTVLGVAAIIMGLIAGSIHVLLLSRTWAGRRRYRWLLHQPYLIPEQRRTQPRNFTEFAVRVLQARQRVEAKADAPPSPRSDRLALEAAQANNALECLLVNALLEDIRQGYARSWWKFWRRVAWARTSYPVLLLDGPDPCLVRRLEEVRATTRSADPLLVIAIGRLDETDLSPVPELKTPVRPEEVEDIWKQWHESWAHDRALSSHRIVRIELDEEDAEFIGKSSVPIRTRRRPALAHPLLPWLVAAAMVVSSLWHVVDATAGNCAPGIERTSSGECVGISDGSFAFHPRTSPPRPATPSKH
jgi:hypothetical protein